MLAITAQNHENLANGISNQRILLLCNCNIHSADYNRLLFLAPPPNLETELFKLLKNKKNSVTYSLSHILSLD